MSLDDLQDCNCVARGCVRKSVFVLFSYAFMATMKTARKLEEDVGVAWDIIAPGFRWSVDERDCYESAMQQGSLPRYYG